MNSIRDIPKPVMISCFLAGMLETYDFMVFGLIASIIHAKYLSHMGSTDSMLITYALFSVGFVCRPIGAIIFGYIGDKKGRKQALVTSVTLMGLASLTMCLLPSYAKIGVTSCYIIALVRILQGLSLGGEFTGGICYIIEHCDKSKSGFAGSFVVGGCLSGMMLSTIVSNIVKLPSMPEYAWRFAFLLGFSLSLVGFFIRQKIIETPEFQLIANKTSKIPLLEGSKEFKLESLTAMMIGATCGTNIYYVIVYIPGYLKNLIGIDMPYLSIITTLTMALLSPFFGWLSDKLDRAKLIFIGALLSGIYALIMLPLILENQTVIAICIIISIHAAIFAIQDGTINVYGLEIFPVKYRYSCSAFFYSIGVGIIGGTSPMIATLITEHFENSVMLLGSYVATISLLAGVCVWLTRLKKLKKSVKT